MPEPRPPFHLLLIVHANQPAGNFEHVFEECYRTAYNPFLTMIEKHPECGWRCTIRAAASVIEKTIRNIRPVAQTGGHRPGGTDWRRILRAILISIPTTDQVEQLNRLGSLHRTAFWEAPNGSVAGRARVGAAPSRFAGGGEGGVPRWWNDCHSSPPDSKRKSCLERISPRDRGNSVWLFPGLKDLRYLIPFRKPRKRLPILEKAAQVHPAAPPLSATTWENSAAGPALSSIGYNGRLAGGISLCAGGEFFLVEDGDARGVHGQPSAAGPRGSAAASYAEMMEWVLPTRRGNDSFGLEKEFVSRPDVLAFLRGGAWRGFFRKYPESNLSAQENAAGVSGVASIPTRRTSAEYAAQIRKPGTAFCEAREMTLIGMASSAEFTRRTCARKSGAI